MISALDTQRPATPGRAAPPRHRRVPWVFGGALIAGLVLRILLYRTELVPANADESFGMLMAARAAAGHFYAFFWSGNYGGTLLTVLEAPFVKVFGLHVTLFRVVNTVVTLIDALLLRALGQRLVGHLGGDLAAGLFWLFPLTWVGWSLQEYVFWLPSIGLSLGVALCGLRWRETTSQWWLLAAGLCAGAAWWEYPLVACLFGPALVVLAAATLKRPSALARLVVGVVVGALPWIYTNLTHHLESLRGEPFPAPPYWKAVGDSITRVLPSALFREGGVDPFRLNAYTAIGIAVFAAALALSVLALARRRYLLALCGVAVGGWPFLLAYSGVVVSVDAYRYAFVILPPLWLLAAWALTASVKRWQLQLAMAAVVVFGAAVYVRSYQATKWQAMPTWDPNLVRVDHLLESTGRDRVFANYWVSSPITVSTQQRVLAGIASGPARDQRAQTLAAAASHSTYVTWVGYPIDQELEAWTTQHHLGDRTVYGQYVVYRFPVRVLPVQLNLSGDT